MSSQQGPKAAPVQHSAHILLGFILREHHSTTANFLDFVGEGRAVGRLLLPAGLLLALALLSTMR